MKKLVWLGLGLAALIVSSCTQKLPLPQTEDEGLLVVFTEGQRACCEFLYRYDFIFGEDEDKVTIKFRSGKRFVSKRMNSGKYLVSKYCLYAVDKGRSYARNGDRRCSDLDDPITVEIKPGKITYFPIKLLSRIVKNGEERFMQHLDVQGVDETMISEYEQILSEAENSDKWQIPNN